MSTSMGLACGMCLQKIIKFIGLFYKMRNILPCKILRQMYYAFVYPHILYGIEIYANACQSIWKNCVNSITKY